VLTVDLDARAEHGAEMQHGHSRRLDCSVMSPRDNSSTVATCGLAAGCSACTSSQLAPCSGSSSGRVSAMMNSCERLCKLV
jgi:hypothetical protein